VTLTDL